MIDVTRKPWKHPDACIAPDIYLPQGMLGSEEREALFWLARDYCVGRGMIVDAGAFLGASAFCLAAGLAHSCNAAAKQTRVFSYDLFVADEEYVASNIRQRFPHFQNGHHFRGLYDAQIGMYKQYIVTIEGDFTHLDWLGLPIELLFVDLDKTPELHATFLRKYYTKLITGHSLVLLQDWYLSRHPWLHFGMEYMSDFFSVVDPWVPWCTRVFRLENPIDVDKLEELASGGLGLDHELALMDRLIERETGPMRQMMKLSRITHLVYRGEKARAATELKALEAEGFCNDETLASETEHARNLVQL